MRSDYTGEELDAIEKLTDSNAYAQGYGWQDNGEWENAIVRLYDIIQAKRASELRKKIETTLKNDTAFVGQPVYYSDDSISSIGDLHGHIVVDDETPKSKVLIKPDGCIDWLTVESMEFVFDGFAPTGVLINGEKYAASGQMEIPLSEPNTFLTFTGDFAPEIELRAEFTPCPDEKYDLFNREAIKDALGGLTLTITNVNAEDYPPGHFLGVWAKGEGINLDDGDLYTHSLNEYTEPETNTIVADRHLGRFRVDFDIIERTPHYVINSAMSNFLIARAESLYHMNAIEYMAYSELFEPTDPACEPPFYSVTFGDDGEVSAEKIGN